MLTHLHAGRGSDSKEEKETGLSLTMLATTKVIQTITILKNEPAIGL